MGKPEKKLKKMLFILGITGAVYGCFRYLLPLVIPFLIAWGLALLLRPSAEWIAGRCRVTVCGRKCGLPAGAVGTAEVLAVLGAVAAGLYYGGKLLCQEARLLMNQIPVWIAALDRLLTGWCHRLEEGLCLRKDLLVVLVREMLRGLLVTVKQAAMPYVMTNSVTIFRQGIGITVFLVILLVSTGLGIQEAEAWKLRFARSVYCREFAIIGHRLRIVANAYLRTQGMIMLLTTMICTAGFWLLKNPYYILAGVGIGILDALPVFGTGTVLVPWAVLMFGAGRWGRGAALLVLYLVCYFLREILEAKMMGDKVGLSPLETLIAMYVGLKLFGIAGFLLGPVGILLICDLVKALEGETENRENPEQVNRETLNRESLQQAEK